MYITWADAVEEGLRLVADLEVNESEIQRDKQEPRDVGSIFARLNALNDERRALEASQQGSVKEADLKGGEAGVPSCRSEPGEIDITQGGVRVCPICRVSVNETLAKGCAISLERCDLAALRATISDKLAKAAQFAREADNAAQEAKRFEALVNQLGPRQHALEAEAKSADAVSRAAQAAAKDVQDRIYRARRILDDVRSLREAETAARPAPPATAALDAVRAQLEAGRSRARAAIRTLEERYQGIMAAWLRHARRRLHRGGLRRRGLKALVVEGRSQEQQGSRESHRRERPQGAQSRQWQMHPGLAGFRREPPARKQR
jgi:hypothetical protein